MSRAMLGTLKLSPVPVSNKHPSDAQQQRQPSKHALAALRKRAKSRKSKRREIEPARDAVWIDASQVCRRYGGRSHMWLVRLLERDESFPRPIIVNRLRYWRLDELVTWEREKAASRVA